MSTRVFVQNITQAGAFKNQKSGVCFLMSELDVNVFKSVEPKIDQLGKGCYIARNYGPSNAGFIITGEGVVVIDATVSPMQAKGVLSEIRKLTDQPIKHLIYTHGHQDHVQGAKVFRDAGATIIGQRNVIERFNRYNKLRKQHIRMNSLQFQVELTEEDWTYNNYPDVHYNCEYIFRLGNKTFHLFHGKGETNDATVVYIPEEEVAYVGDFVMWVFPNIGNPQKVIRYEREWYETLERILSMEPKAVGTGHGPSLLDDKSIKSCLGDNIAVLKYLHEECIKHINEGSSLEQMLEEIQLPKKLAVSPYIPQTYGRREFVIRGIHRRYTGWFDGNPANLDPAPQKEINSVILSLIGGKKLIEKVKSLSEEEGKQRLALHLLDLIGEDDLEYREARQLRIRLLEDLAAKHDNLFYRNFYSGFAVREKNCK